MVTTFLSELMEASKAISAPLESVVLRVIKVSRSELEIFEPFELNIAVLKVSVIFLSTATPVAEFNGENLSSATSGVRVVAIEPLPLIVFPVTVIAKQLVYKVPDEVISKSLSIAIALDCEPLVPPRVTS